MPSSTSQITNQPILIGDLLVRSEMASPAAMADAIPISLKTGLPIGRVLTAAGTVSEQQLQQALLAQSLIRDSLLSLHLAIDALRIVVKENFTLKQALEIIGWQPESFSNENKLGQLLLAAQVINQLQLDEALSVFYTAGLPLARVLVRKGAISNLVAYAALSSQQLLRDSKLSREQAIQALKAASSSNAVIEDDYVNGYLRLGPSNNLRLGELLVLSKLVSEEALIIAVEAALTKGETLGEVLVNSGLVGADTMVRALDAQRLVTKGQLDVAKAGDVLRKANYERLSILKAMENDAPAVLVSTRHVPKTTQTQIASFNKELVKISLQQAETKQPRPRSSQETRARQLVSRLLDKLEALHVRNNYLLNVLEKDAKNELGSLDLYEMKRQIELVADFDDSMDVLDRLLTKIETCAYQNGFLRARLDAVAVEADLIDKLSSAELAVQKLTAKVTEYQPVSDASAQRQAQPVNKAGAARAAHKDPASEKPKSSAAAKGQAPPPTPTGRPAKAQTAATSRGKQAQSKKSSPEAKASSKAKAGSSEQRRSATATKAKTGKPRRK